MIIQIDGLPNGRLVKNIKFDIEFVDGCASTNVHKIENQETTTVHSSTFEEQKLDKKSSNSPKIPQDDLNPEELPFDPEDNLRNAFESGDRPPVEIPDEMQNQQF